MMHAERVSTRPLIVDRGARAEQGAPIRVVIGDRELLTREYLASMLAVAAGIELVAACATGRELRAAIADNRPQVVVMCPSLAPGGLSEGVRLVTELRETEPQTGVVVLTRYLDPELALAILDAGTAGRAYLLKEELRSDLDLLSAITAVAAGDSLIDPHVVDVLIAARTTPERSPLGRLTMREREVLGEIASARSNAAIAETLVITQRAVEKHVNSIFMKLNVSGDAAISARVMAARIYLAEQPTAKPSTPSLHQAPSLRPALEPGDPIQANNARI